MSFHVQPRLAGLAGLKALYRQDKYLSMLDMMFSSASLFDTRAKAVLLTDGESKLRGLSRRFELVRSTVRPQSMMLDRTSAQVTYLKREKLSEPVAFLDSDILINASLDSIFEQDFDIALTWRKSANMPINGGFFVVNNRRPDAAITFMEGFLHTYREHYGDKAEWYGDQLALRDWVGLSHRQIANKGIAMLHGCKVLFLPCERFNHSPPEHATDYIERDSKAAVLHFKGNRKRYMSLYWDAHLATLVRSTIRTRHAQGKALRELRQLAESEPFQASQNGSRLEDGR